jgi:predicted TIM-barrel fold metal-dependent hydrolase
LVDEVIDFHVHIFPPEVVSRREAIFDRDRYFAWLYGRRSARLAAAEDLVAALDGAEIRAAVAMNFGWSDPELCRRTNDYLLDAAQRFPGRIYPCVMVPFGEPDLAVAELERAARAGAVGLGEVMPDGQGLDLDHPESLGPILSAADRLGLFVVVHASEPVGHRYPGKGTVWPHRLERLYGLFPRVQFVFAHLGGGLPFYGLMPEVKAALRNVWFDTAALPFLYEPEAVRIAAEIVGPERLLFGTDFPLINYGRMFNYLGRAGLSPAGEAPALKAFFVGNARRLLHLGGPG